MKALLQRVSRAEVRVAGAAVGRIEHGLVILLGVLQEDDAGRAERCAQRCARLRIFPDQQGRMNRSLLDAGGAALVVSQITLAWEGGKGLRPSFDRAAAPAHAERLYRRFLEVMRELGVSVASGVFGERMEVELVNDGPVTFLVEETG
jgi:D-tyrosyl-tRNA(Tyr) deacylase